MILRPFLLLSLSLPLLVLAAEQAPCTVVDPETHEVYDLSPLAAEEDYTAQSHDGVEYRLNVCRGLASDPPDLDNPSEHAGYYTLDGETYSLGHLNSTPSLLPTTPPRLLLTYSSGSPCSSSSNLRASTAISFTCARSRSPSSAAQLVAKLDEACAFFFEFPTPHACAPQEHRKEEEHWTAWGLFFTIALLALLAYFASLTLYNRRVLHLRGAAQIPHYLSLRDSLHRLPTLSSLPCLPRRRRAGFGTGDGVRWGAAGEDEEVLFGVGDEEEDLEGEGIGERDREGAKVLSAGRDGVIRL